jgi:hypothetical protein
MKKKAIIISFVTFLSLIYLPIIAFFVKGSSAYFQFFAADTFYYLTIAANESWKNIASFDGINPTNGFHPLWQFFLKTTFFILDIHDKPQQIAITFWVSVFFVAIAASLITYSLKKAGIIKSNTLLFLSLSIGFMYFIIATPNPNYGYLWSYINGMESPLSLFLFSLFIFFIVNRANFYDQTNPTLFLTFGSLVSLIILARLDDVFILAGLAAPILVSRQPPAEKLKRFFRIGVIPVVAITLYVAFNNYYAGSYLPISGQSKGGLSLSSNLAFALNGFAPFIPYQESGWNWWNETTWRALQMLAPLIIALIFCYFFLKGKYSVTENKALKSFDVFLFGLAIYVILKALYNLIFVGIWHQGHWYYPISIVVVNIMVARHIDLMTDSAKIRNIKLNLTMTSVRFGLAFLFLLFAYISYTARLSKPLFLGLMTLSMIVFASLLLTIRRSSVLRIPVFLVFSVLFVILSGNSILSNKEKTSYNQHYESLFRNRLRIKSELLNIDPELRLLSFDDGIDAYSLGFPTMSGLGFALDKEAFEAKKNGKLLDIAYKRGFKWLTTLNYMPDFTAHIGDDVSNYLSSAWWLTRAEAGSYKFTLVYFDPETKLKIISFRPSDRNG